MPQLYSYEALAEAAAAAWCMTDFMQRLGVEVDPNRRRHLASRLKQLAIDTNHGRRLSSRNAA
jgi:hypothetical protein